MRQTSSGEDGNLLTTSDGVHNVDGRYSGLNHFLRVDTRPRIDRLSLNVQIIFREDRWSLVDRFSRTVENTAQHVLGHRGPQNVTGEFTVSVLRVDAGCALENLDHRFRAGDLQNLAGA